MRTLTGFRVYCRREHVPDVNCGCRGGDCGDVDAEAASWRPPTLADERHDERHLLLPLRGAQSGSPQGWASHVRAAAQARAAATQVFEGVRNSRYGVIGP